MCESYPESLPEFQRRFPDDSACATYLEQLRWPKVFICPLCMAPGDPFRFAARPGVLRCRACRRDISLMAGTIMERSHTPLSTWFWASYLVASMTPGMSAVQFQRQLGLKRYETAFGLLHKLRAGMVRPERDRIGGPRKLVELDETWVGGRTRGEGRGRHHKSLVVAAVEVLRRKTPDPAVTQRKATPRRGGKYAGRLRLSVAPDRTARTLLGFTAENVAPGTHLITDDHAGYDQLGMNGYRHTAVAERGDPKVADEWLPLVHLVFSNLKTWLNGVHHGVSKQHLQAYLNEFVFRFNRRFYPFSSFRSLLGICAESEGPTREDLYSGEWEHACSTGGVCGK